MRGGSVERDGPSMGPWSLLRAGTLSSGTKCVVSGLRELFVSGCAVLRATWVPGCVDVVLFMVERPSHTPAASTATAAATRYPHDTSVSYTHLTLPTSD